MADCWMTISGELVVGHDVWAAPAVAPDGDARPPQDGARACRLASSDRRTPGGDPQPPRLVLLNDRASGRSSPQIDRVIAASWLIVAVSPCPSRDRVLAVPSPTRVIDHR
jgi:hypothetical protein